MWKMSFCDSDQKSMPIVGFLTCNGSGIFCGPKLVPIGGLDTELISRLQRAIPACLEMSRSENIPHCPCMAMHLIESSHNPLSSGYTYDSVPLGRAVMEHDTCP